MKKKIITDPMGQWKYPGENTRIPSNKITMKGVNYPVLGVSNNGQRKMMQPGQEYNFPGADYVDEFPQLKRGGRAKGLIPMPKPSKKGLASKKYSRSLEATNRLFTENKLFEKPKSRKNKVFDPNAKYYQDGGATSPEEWGQQIKDIEGQIGNPADWTMNDYYLLQDKLNAYRDWRENTPEGQAVIDSHNEEGEYDVPLPEHLQDYTNAMMKARLAYANEFGNPAAQRMINLPDNPYEFDDGNTGTHYMASMDNYAVPQIQDENGQLMLGDYGPDSREAMRFDSDEDANYFAEHYKDVSPGFIEADLTPEEIQEYERERPIKHVEQKEPEEQTEWIGEHPRWLKDGGSAGDYIELDIPKEQIQKYVDGGYIVEDISIPSLTKAQGGGSPKSKWIAPAERYSGRSNVDPRTGLIYKDFGDVDVKAGKKGFKKKVKSFFQKDLGKLTKEAEELGKGVGYIAGVQGDIEPAVYNREGLNKFKSEVKRLKGDFNKDLKAAEKERKQEAADREDYEKAREKAQSSKDPNAGSNFARKYEEKNWSRFDPTIMKEGSKGQFQDAVDEANARKTKNFETVKNIAGELSGYNSAGRIIENPLGTLKGVGQTVADVVSLPVGLTSGAYNYATEGNFDMGKNIIGQNYGEGIDEIGDVASVLPFVSMLGVAGKTAKLTKANKLINKITKPKYKNIEKNIEETVSNGLTDVDVAAARAEDEAWLNSPEYLKRRMANTGESAEEIKKDIASIMTRANKATYDINATIDPKIHGYLDKNSFAGPKVFVSSKSSSPLETLKHEDIHLYSPVSEKSFFSKDLHKGWDNPNVENLPASERGVYANYPTIGDVPESAMYPNVSDYNYNMLGYEQQAKHLGVMRDIAKKNNVDLNAGEKLTEAQVRGYIDNWADNINNFDNDYDTVWAAEIINEREKLAKALGTTSDELMNTNPEKYDEIRKLARDKAAEKFTGILNKAWIALPATGVAGTATMLANPFEKSTTLSQQRRGGQANNYIEIEIPEEEIQKYVDGGFVVEEVNNPSVSKLNTFAGGGETQCGDNEKWDDRLQKCVKIVQNLSESTHYDPAGKKVQATLFQKLKDAKDAYQNFTKQHRGKKYRLNEADSASSIEQLRKGIQLYKDEYAKEQEQTKHELKKLENLKSKAALKDNKDIQNLSLKDLNTVKGKMKIESAIRNSNLDSGTIAALYTGLGLSEVDANVKKGYGPDAAYSAKEAEANAMKNVPEFVDMVSKVATAIPLAGTAGALAGSFASAANVAGRALAPAVTTAGKVIFNPVTQGILAAPAIAQMALHPLDTITGAATTGVELYDKAMGDKDDVNRFGNPYWQDVEHLANTAALLPGISSLKALRELVKTKKGFDFAVKYVKPVKDFYKKGVRKYIKTTAPILNTNVPGVAAGVADSVIGGRGATEVVNRAGQLLQNVPEWAVPTVGNTLKGIGYATAGYTGIQGAGNIQEGLSEGNKEQFDAGIAKAVDAATTLATLTPAKEVGAATQPLLVLATAKEIKDNIAKEETGSTAFNSARIINQIAGLPTSSNQILPRQSVKALRRLKVKHIRKHLKKGGVVSELSQKEIDDLVAQGYIIEELD